MEERHVTRSLISHQMIRNYWVLQSISRLIITSYMKLKWFLFKIRFVNIMTQSHYAVCLFNVNNRSVCNFRSFCDSCWCFMYAQTHRHIAHIIYTKGWKQSERERDHLVIIIRKWYIKGLNKHMNLKSMNTLRYKNTSNGLTHGTREWVCIATYKCGV